MSRSLLRKIVYECETFSNMATQIIIMFMLVALASGQNTTSSKNFTLVNVCKVTIWPGILTKSGNNPRGPSALKPGETAFYKLDLGWSGRMWARTGCSFDKNGTGQCETGGCGASLNCTVPSIQPNTIAEITVGEPDYYDISLQDGFNVPIAIVALNGKGDCRSAGCDGDLRGSCPSELAFKPNGEVVACRSACDAFKNDTYCCRETNDEQGPCILSNYSSSFKKVCPATSITELNYIISCSATEYVVAFCASRNQTVCSYHGNGLLCNTSSTSYGMKTLPQSWWIMVLGLALMSNLHLKY